MSMEFWSRVMRQLEPVMAEAKGFTLVDYIFNWQLCIRERPPRSLYLIHPTPCL
jgi:hypothetical protein